MRNRDRRKANERRRAIAALKQHVVPMRGSYQHPIYTDPTTGKPLIVTGQLDRAEARQREYQARYPYPPVYVTKIGK